MKLGQRVKFTKHWVKAGEHVTEEMIFELDGDPYIMPKLKPKEEVKEGIVAGKRTLGIESHLDYFDGEYSSGIQCIHTEYKQFYLVACDLRGFYKVLAEDLEVVS